MNRAGITSAGRPNTPPSHRGRIGWPPAPWRFLLNITLFFFVLSFSPPTHLQAHASTSPIQFNRDIRPILSENCFACHGPDSNQRKAGLRLDQRDEALKPAKSGKPAIVPGKREQSTLLDRIHSQDPDQIMPPPDSHRTLTPKQKELLSQWIESGATYQAHWAFIPPEAHATPAVKQRSWSRNAIDTFILATIESHGLKPSPEADRTTLIRRLSLDLTGLPPSLQEIDAYLSDRDSNAYEKVVDRLLASEHYGERMAVDWLDAARFADSNGYQVDRDREMYAWRDWVIGAFNANKRFDTFTLEQLAGDLLPNPTLAQRIATGFHRNHMANEEGGIIPEEFLAEYCADRVETTATVWLAQTFNCARCHNHKFDPFTQKDFYSLYAFFHNVSEKGVGEYSASIRRNNPPMIQLPSPELEAKREGLRKDHAFASQKLALIKTNLIETQSKWESTVSHFTPTWSPPQTLSFSILSNNIHTQATQHLLTLSSLTPGSHRFSINFPSPQIHPSAIQLRISLPSQGSLTSQVSIASVSLKQIQTGGKTNPIPLRALERPESAPISLTASALDPKAAKAVPILTSQLSSNALLFGLDSASQSLSNSTVATWRLEGSLRLDQALSGLQWELGFTESASELFPPNSIRTLLSKSVTNRTPDETKQIIAFRESNSSEHRQWATQTTTLARQVDEVDLQIPTALIMAEMPTPRPTHVLMRGAYDRKGEQVEPNTPASLPPMPQQLPRNRLGLAQWLVDPSNPLPARVTVNRFWQSLFGTGLVRTAEDFGVQGTPPSHPELLDWLSVEFIRNGWNVKALMRLMVTSATYRQSSKLTPQLLEMDPENRWLARGSRFRLQAEFVRDQALAVSGLLVRKTGGPSVRPYHPPGLYEQVVAGSSANTYVVGEGDDLYRRSLYTYWKRSVPNPAMLLFDMPFRESCTVRRTRTNTPLQALNLLNDPTFVEAATMLSQRALREGGNTLDSRITHAFRLATARHPSTSELRVLRNAFLRAQSSFAADIPRARQWIKSGVSTPDLSLSAIDLAAMTTVASTILNLDEVVTKE